MSLAEKDAELTHMARAAIQAAAPDATLDYVDRLQRECQDEQGKGRGVYERNQIWALTLPAERTGEQFLSAAAKHWQALGYEVDDSRIHSQRPIVRAVTDDEVRLSAGRPLRDAEAQSYADIAVATPCMQPTLSDISDFDPQAPPPEPPIDPSS